MRRLIQVLVLALISGAIVATPASASTYTVTNSNNSGAGSLRQAVLDANANAGTDTISFLTNYNITLLSEIEITDTVYISGAQQNIVLSGGDANRIFKITAGDVYLSHLTLTHGNSGSASLVLVEGQGTMGTGIEPEVNIDTVTFSDSTSTGNLGALAVLNNAQVTVENSLFEGNSGAAITQDWGSLENILTITHTIFRDNSTGSTSIGVVNSTRHLYIDSSVFIDNTSGAVYKRDRSLQLKNSLFIRNAEYAVKSTASEFGTSSRAWGIPVTNIYNNTFYNNNKALYLDLFSTAKNNIIQGSSTTANGDCSIYGSSVYSVDNNIMTSNATDGCSSTNTTYGAVAFTPETTAPVSTMPAVVLPVLRPYLDSLGKGTGTSAVCTLAGSVDQLAVIRSVCDMGAITYSTSNAPTVSPTPTPSPTAGPSKLGTIRFANKSAKMTAKVKLQIKKLLPRLRTASSVELRMNSRLKGAKAKEITKATALNKKRLVAIKKYLTANRVNVRLVNKNNATLRTSKRATAAIALWKTA